jgi:hypothetical protein
MSFDKTFDIMTAGKKVRVLSGSELDHQNSVRIDLLGAKVQAISRALDGGGLGAYDGHAISAKLQEMIKEAEKLKDQAGPTQPILDLLSHLTALAAQVNAEISANGPRPAVPASQKTLGEPESLVVERDWMGELRGTRTCMEPANESPVVGRDLAGNLIQVRTTKSESPAQVSRGVYYNKDGNLAMEE